MSFIEIIIISVVLLVVLSIAITTLRVGISPMPSSHQATQVILAMLPERVEGTIVELGSGWGTLAFPIYRNGSESRVIGMEVSFFPWLWSRLVKCIMGYKNLNLVRQDFHRASLREASVVVCYLFPQAMTNLHEKLREELRPGSLVISNTFRLPGWSPEKVVVLQDAYRTPVYLYRVGGAGEGKAG